MKRLLMSSVGLLALGLVALTPADSFGFGCRRACGGNSGCGSPCATTAVCATTAPATVEYVERKVTRYKDNWVEKEITEKVSKMVATKEKYKYWTMESKTTPTKRKVTVHKQVMADEEFTYTVNVPQMKTEKRKETFYTSVNKNVEYEYTVMVPRTVVEKRMVTSYVCQTNVVKEMVPVCRTVRVACCDPCDPCGRVRYTCQRVTEMQEVCRTVVTRVPVQKEVEVSRIVCDAEKRKGTRTVCELVKGEREVDVQVCNYVQEQRKGKRTVCRLVAEEREEVVNVVTCEKVEREGERVVHTCVTEDVKRKVKVNQPIAEVVTERVPVSTCAVSTGCGHSRGCGLCSGGGLFRNRGHGCGGCR